jgi:hypothetical protein
MTEPKINVLSAALNLRCTYTSVLERKHLLAVLALVLFEPSADQCDSVMRLLLVPQKPVRQRGANVVALPPSA